MKRNEGKREILKENRQKENGINVSETILALLLVSAIFVSVQDLYYSNWCMIAALVAGVLVILLCQVNEVWLNHSGMIRGGIYGVTVVGFIISITMVVQGFLYTVDRGILLWNARFGTENMQLATGSMAGIGSVILWGLLSVPTASFLLSQIKKRSLWGPVLLVTLAGAFGVILGQTEAWTGMFLTVAALTGIFILYGAPERSFGPYGISYFLSLGVLLVLLVVITEPYESLRMVEQGKQQLEDAFEKFRYGEDSLPQGEFRKAGKLLEGESDTLKITMDVPQELYLRGFVGADYETDGWKKSSAKQYQGEYDGMLSWLEKQEFSAITQYAIYAGLTAEHENTDVNDSGVLIDNVGAYRKYVYLPSAAESWSEKQAKEEKDSQVQSRRFFGTSDYRFTLVNEAPNAEDAYPAIWTETGSDTAENQYLDAESVYHSFAEDAYMEVDTEHTKLIKQIFFPEGEEELSQFDFADVTTRIRQTLRANTQYTKSPDQVPQGVDLVQWFLEDYKKGNAISYASTAVLAYRVAGYPARYAEGYHLPGTDAQQMEENGETEITLTTQNAHAWVEVYVNEMGWLPVEVVPGMYVETYSSEKVEGKPAYQVNPSKQDSGAKTDEDGKDGRNNNQTELDEKKIINWRGIFSTVLIGILYLGLAIYLILELQRTLRRIYRRRKQYQVTGEDERISAYVDHMEYLLKAGHIKGDFAYPEELKEEVRAKLPTIPIQAYERTVELIQKSRFGGRELKPHEKHTLRAFEERMHRAIYQNRNMIERWILRYWYAV